MYVCICHSRDRKISLASKDKNSLEVFKSFFFFQTRVEFAKDLCQRLKGLGGWGGGGGITFFGLDLVTKKLPNNFTFW